MPEITSVACGDDYTAAATLKDVFTSGGGVFEVQGQPAKYKLQYGGQGLDYWTDDATIGTGGGPIPAGATGVAFKNAVAGQTATVSALIRPRTQPHLELSFPSTPVVTVGAMQLVQTQTLAVAAAGFIFTVPATFAHLIAICSLRSTVAGALDTPLVRLNNDVGADYDYEFVAGQAGVVVASSVVGATSIFGGAVPGGAAPAGYFGGQRIELPNYLSLVAHKPVIAVGGANANAGTDLLRTVHGLWRPAVIAAVTRLDIFPSSGPNFAAGSTISLYGVAG